VSADVADFEHELNRLNEKLDALLHLCEQLHQEKRTIQERHDQLLRERAQLVEKTALARGRVEEIMARLKAVEFGES
jgi:cell division protein ZapB